MTTSLPLAKNASATCEPMYPAPPVSSQVCGLLACVSLVAAVGVVGMCAFYVAGVCVGCGWVLGSVGGGVEASK